MSAHIRMLTWAGAAVACVLFASSMDMIAGVEDSARVAVAADACREEDWVVAIISMGGNPRYVPLQAFQRRTVLVCDEKTLVEIKRGHG